VGLLKVQKVGNQTQFCANTDHPVYPELLGLVRKSIGLVDVLQAALAPLGDRIQVAFVYGSVAEGSEGPRSDVDVMVLGDAGFGEVVNALYDSQATLGREVNPKVMSLAEWHSRKLAADTGLHHRLRLRGQQPQHAGAGGQHLLRA